MGYLEVKRHLNKPNETYCCELVDRGDDHVLLQYVNDHPASIGPVEFPAGTTTLAFYREGAGNVVWRMVEAPGRILGHLFHICRDLHIEETRVVYTDLLLDLWFDSEGRLSVLDEEELNSCYEEGTLSDEDLTRVKEEAARIREEFPGFVERFDSLLAES